MRHAEISQADHARDAFGPTAGDHCARCGAMLELVTWRGVVLCAVHAAEQADADHRGQQDDGFEAHEDAHRAGRI